MQYSLGYTVQMQKEEGKKKKKTRKNTHTHKEHFATKEQIPPFRRAFQELDEC